MADSPIRKDDFVQVALVCRDITASATAFAKLLGVPVPDVIETAGYEATQATYRGAPMTNARAKLAFFRTGAVSIELIEPIGGPSVWQEHLDTHGEGVHHIAFRVADMDAAVDHLEGQGAQSLQRGDFTGGCYTYLDSEPLLGVMVELLGPRPQ